MLPLRTTGLYAVCSCLKLLLSILSLTRPWSRLTRTTLLLLISVTGVLLSVLGYRQLMDSLFDVLEKCLLATIVEPGTFPTTLAM